MNSPMTVVNHFVQQQTNKKPECCSPQSFLQLCDCISIDVGEPSVNPAQKCACNYRAKPSKSDFRIRLRMRKLPQN